MAKLFLLAVGGTGVRVTKALLHTLAAGVKPRDPWTIVPIVLDPHKSNDDLQRTTELLRDYVTLERAARDAREKGHPAGGFFATRIQTLFHEDGMHGRAIDPLAELTDIGDKRFREYIGLDGFGESLKTEISLTHALYDDRQLDVRMDIGFVGNPAIGVVALDNLSEHEAIKKLASSLAPDDRIFIVSSLFGGTGAAAFPLLVKLFREASTLPNPRNLKEAIIGALSVQPYFQVEQSADGRILQREFIERTKEALRYYARTLPGKVEAFYTIGESSKRAIDNDPGEDGQRNDAHFAELAGALSIIDFLDRGFERGHTEEFEYALAKDESPVTFEGFAQKDRKRLRPTFTRMYMLARFMKDAGEGHLRKGTSISYAKAFGAGFEGTPEPRALVSYAAAWREWLAEMARSDRSLRPFNDGEGYVGAVRGVKEKSGAFMRKMRGTKLSAEGISGEANKLTKQITNIDDPGARYIAIIGEATAAQVEANLAV